MKIRIGTRASLLAMTQTKMVAAALAGVDSSIECEIIQIKTSGDAKQGKPLAGFGDKKDWVYELELALLNNQIDIAVHSAKDVPGNIESGLNLLPVLERASPYDIFIGKKLSNGSRIRFSDLASTATIGTSSLRRKASLFFYNSKFKVIDHRGNVTTRIQKLDDSDQLSGIILARAGVDRINALTSDQFEELPRDIMLPAMNQGILCAQHRESDSHIIDILNSLSTSWLKKIFFIERAIATSLEGDCNSAISIYSCVNDSDKNKLDVLTRVMSIPMNKQIHLNGSINAQDSYLGVEFDSYIKELILNGAKELA